MSAEHSQPPATAQDQHPHGDHGHDHDNEHRHESTPEDHADHAENGGHDRGDHGHDHGGPAHGSRLAALWHKLSHLVTPHSHDAMDKVDSAMAAFRDGIRALWISLAVLGATAVTQAVVVVLSGSVALLGDTLHNVADALTAVPLGIAFVLGRRTATRRYTYGYGRAEDLAGIVIVVVIATSAALAAYQAIDRLIHPADVSHLV